MKQILKCPDCGNYTLLETCPACDKKTARPIPQRYSPIDKYGMYRRKVKFDKLKEEGLL